MEAPQKTVDGHYRSTHRRSRSGLWYPGRVYVSGHQDIFDMVDIDLFTVIALNMMVVKLGYTGESEPLFYNYLRPLTSLDEGLYALACEEDVRCLATLVRSFKLIEVYIEHGVTALDCYIRPPREPTKEPVCDSVTPSSLPQHDSSTPCKVSVCDSITPRCMPDCMLTPPTNESVITYTQLSGVHGVDTQSHFLPTIQSQFSDINLSFVSQQATASQVIDDVMRQLSFEETELDGEAGFADVAGSGVESSGLSHDESFGVDDLDLNLNEPEPILAEVSTQEPIMAEVSTEVPIVEEGNGQEDKSAPTDGQFFYNDEGIDTAYETEYDVQSSEDTGTDDDDDVDEDFLVDEENEIVELDVDVHLFGISMDLPFDNIGFTNLVSNDVLEGEDVDVINANGFDSDPGVINASGQWKYSFYTAQKFNTPKEAKDRVYLHFIESRRNLKLYNNDSVRMRARCKGKVLVFTMSQGTGPTGLQSWKRKFGLGDQVPTTRGKKGKIRASSAISVKEFGMCMLELKTMNPKEHEWLIKIPPEHWTRSHFLGKAKFDLLFNNICDVFNGKIVGDKDKPVITLLEYIKKYFMKRIVNVQSVIEKCIGPLTPTTTRIMESIKKEAHLMKEWTGIPCKHVVSACWNMALNDWAAPPPEAWVNPCGNNAEAIGSVSRQAQQTELAVGQDGSGGSGAGIIIGLPAAAGQSGAGGLGGTGVG
ncbi:hypothetical protein Tco_1033496 [Tanacetum coccineum]